MGFVPIKIGDFVRDYVKRNHGETADQVTARLRSALEDYKAGVLCSCGEPIWVIGSSIVGNMCFTCITGEAYPTEDYEIAEACDKASPVSSRSAQRRQAATPAASEDSGFEPGATDDDVPF